MPDFDSSTPVIFYDQLGNGESSHIPDATQSFWTVELFMNELDNLVSHLGIEQDFILLGQSWGGVKFSSYCHLPRLLTITDASIQVCLQATGLPHVSPKSQASRYCKFSVLNQTRCGRSKRITGQVFPRISGHDQKTRS
jgi:hypothetical protein